MKQVAAASAAAARCVWSVCRVFVKLLTRLSACSLGWPIPVIARRNRINLIKQIYSTTTTKAAAAGKTCASLMRSRSILIAILIRIRKLTLVAFLPFAFIQTSRQTDGQTGRVTEWKTKGPFPLFVLQLKLIVLYYHYVT